MCSPLVSGQPPFFCATSPKLPTAYLASHLTKVTAITNSEYMDFATLLPMTSHLTDTIHSHLNHKVDDQGLTFPLPSSSKRPQITFIDQWLNAFAIYFAVIVSVYPSRAADLIASKHGSFEMRHKSSPGWLSMFMMWSSKGVLLFGLRSTPFLFDEFFFLAVE